MGIASAMSAISLATSQPASAASYPAALISHYEGNADTSTLMTQGKNDATSAGNNQGYVVEILDFGRPAYNSGCTCYGTIAINTGNWLSNSSILAAVKAYSDGWASKHLSGTKVMVSIGTSNNCFGCFPDRLSGFSAFGTYWAERTRELAAYMATHNYVNQRAWAAFDLEPAWDSQYTDSKDMINAYDTAARSGTGYVPVYADYGSADSSWTQKQIWNLSYAVTTALAFPEIYYPYQQNMATEWQGVYQWAEVNGHKDYIFGSTDNYYANTCTLTPDETYNYLLSYINKWQKSMTYAVRYPC